MNNSTFIHFQPGETLFDVAIKRYGHMQGLLNLIEGNGFGFTDEPTPGDVLEIDPSANFDNLKVINVSAVVNQLPNKAIVEPGQSIFDMAIQIYGDLSGLQQLSEDNDKGFTDDLVSGEIIKSRAQVNNKLLVQYLKSKNIKPATGVTETEAEELKPEGIGYWAIEYDFVVS